MSNQQHTETANPHNKIPHGGTETQMNRDLDQNQTRRGRTGNIHPSNMSETPNQETLQRPLQIRQQNVNKSLISQLDLLQSIKRDDYNICVIQEPYIDFRGKTRANRQWSVIYPSTHQEHPDSTRSVILINANLVTDAWKQIHFQHPDITAIEIQGHLGTLRIINIYNDGDNNNALMHISTFMRDRERQIQAAGPLYTMWMGDFN